VVVPLQLAATDAVVVPTASSLPVVLELGGKTEGGGGGGGC
jgi:hypothetical protein